jgi:hypothetical protein
MKFICLIILTNFQFSICFLKIVLISKMFLLNFKNIYFKIVS